MNIILLNIVLLLSNCDQGQIDHKVEVKKKIRYSIKDKTKGSGNFLHGKKDGLWTYQKEDYKVSILWTSYKDSVVDAIYPLGWKHIEVALPLFAVYDSIEEASIMVFKVDLPGIGMTLNEYQKECLDNLKGQYNSKTISQNVVEIIMPNGAAFTSFYIINDKTGILTFYIEQNRQTYNFTYKFRITNSDISRNEIIFWDFIDNFKHANSSIFPESGLPIISIGPKDQHTE
jgi:hypothetical protein